MHGLSVGDRVEHVANGIFRERRELTPDEMRAVAVFYGSQGQALAAKD
jgi:hypothetical protein